MTEMGSPAIGITCSRIETSSKHRPLYFGQNQTYAHALIRAGTAPLLIPPLGDHTLLPTLYERLDGLLFSGGGDIAPARYGEPVHEKCGSAWPERDEMELTLARWAMDDGKPVLAICRGIQVLNVALGGTLYQDIEAQIPGAERHPWYPDYPRNRLSHPVVVIPDTRLAHILGATSLPVNSLHHQAVKDVAPGLAVVARAPDGVIEGVEAQSHPFAIGVQWHPEDLAADQAHHQRLFDALAEACRGQPRREP
jgi:putative glutamine amidotransferase